MANNNNSDNKNYSYAPYNFIPLSKRVIERYNSKSELPKHSEFIKEALSGEIEYTIENNTDIIISDGKGKFFKNTNGKHTIPGSTIRGKLRSNMNTLGFSAVGNDIENERFLYRRFASLSSNLNKEYENRLDIKRKTFNDKTFSTPENVKAGYIKKIGDEEYIIISGKEIKGKTYFKITEKDLIEKCKNIKEIKFMKNSNYEPYCTEISYEVNENKSGIKAVNNKGKLSKKGFILGSGKIARKKAHYVINEIDMNSEPIKIPANDVRMYNKYYIKDKKSKLNRNGFYSLPEKINEMKPVFYAKYNSKIYFGFTEFIRILYDKSIFDGIDDKHKKHILDYKNSIFGYSIGDDSYKSRVSVEDAIICTNPRTTTHTMVLQEPKATCVQLYLTQDSDRNGLYSYNGDFEIRGIKYYWLKNLVKPVKATDNVNSVEEAIQKGAKFKGKITFNNLYEDELGLLLWCLYINKDAKQNIGKGKPYGFGNIKIKDIKLKVKDTNNLYNDIFEDNLKESNFENYINKYKKDVVKYFDTLENIEEDLAVRTFIEVHKNSKRNDKVEYMGMTKDILYNNKLYNGFELYNPLLKPLEILGVENRKYKKTVVKNNSNNNSNDINKNQRPKSRVNNRVSRYSDGELSHGFGALANYFKN